jgi:murein DD-endopeptidase MepM/ murein hydrolase activator NlpD
MIMPDISTVEVRRVRISRRLVHFAIAIPALLLLICAAAFVFSAYVWDQAKANDTLRAENETLRARLAGLDFRLEEVDGVIERVKQFDTKLRTLTMISDPERHLAIGPVGGSEEPSREPGKEQASLRTDLLGQASRSLNLVQTRISEAESEAHTLEKRVQTLSAYLEDQQAILASTPSRAPARGFVSSTFGMRVDPFTGLPNLHAGIDFSANIGARVSATADGLVLFAAKDPAYGNIIKIDHGNGLVSHYAHLSKMNVKIGEKVKRGQLIGAVGNTGRSTGPHLHYEIRVNGVPQDPQRFLLD